MPLAKLERFGPHLPDWASPHWPDFPRWMKDFGIETVGFLRIEEIRDDGELVIRAEAPGVDPEKDIDVSVTDGILHIAAKRSEHVDSKEKGTYRSEFRYGELTRDLVLPDGVDMKTVKAEYKDGILEVRLPWPEEKETPATIKVPVHHN